MKLTSLIRGVGPTLALAALLSACRSPDRATSDAALQRFEFTQAHMGTTFRLVLYARDADQARRAGDRAFARVEALEQTLSDYREDSELRRLCAAAASGDGEAHAVSEDLYAVLRASQAMARATGGAFDVTVGPFVQLWRRSVRQQERPSAERLEQARRSVGHEFVQLDPRSRTVALTRAGMRLDVGGIGKGFAADAALTVLAECGVTRALVDAGGDIAVSAPPPGAECWHVAVNVAPDTAAATLVLGLAHAAVATSGDQYQSVTLDGIRYSHIVDPRTGLGSTRRQAATVIAPDGATADALASALCVLGAEGLALVAAMDGVEARVVRGDPAQTESTEVVETDGFARWMLARSVQTAR